MRSWHSPFEARRRAFNEIFHPIAGKLLEKGDAVLRAGGASEGADQMINVARQPGLKVFFALEDIPDQ